MNLQELKQGLRQNTDMTSIYSKIKSCAEEGEAYAIFTEDELSATQREILRDAGYTVEWERPCLWYEISGWK